ncbi:hypothetical protein NP233_g7635 [Leucocoprinus birnbaumii]|uniref:S-adenosyl-L-methionine-dependent methyltransferase n=1 Tax=Leucocoprinus birnbaumii TaxID=56174 RepID=A0AAD5VRH1_9AGAR|nr:hypothetical protein NP233_g7635 [Leucocoprinus birnbaumii]
MSTEPLSALLEIINTRTEELKKLLTHNGVEFPSLDVAVPTEPTALNQEDRATELSEVIVAAASQLINTVRDPKETIWENVTSMYMTTSLAFVVEVDIPEVLNEAPDNKLHVDDIAAAVNCNASHVARILRYLASRHVFKEIIPDVFSNNRISSTLIKANGKNVAQLKENPLEKWSNSGVAAMAGVVGGEGIQWCSGLLEFLKTSGKAGLSPFNIAADTDKSLWEWYEEPQNAWRSRRFAALMQGRTSFTKEEIIQNAYEWERLGSDDVVVDVGGSVGALTFAIAKKFPGPRFVLQDLPTVINRAKMFWRENSPETVSSGRLTLQVHNFFDPQPVKGAAVYFMANVLHDWPDEKCLAILRNIREAAAPSSKLILLENGVAYACEDPRDYGFTFERRGAPWPLIPNLGKGGGPALTAQDMQMLNLFNGEERNVRKLIQLGKETGWKLVSIKTEILSAFVFSAI